MSDEDALFAAQNYLMAVDLDPARSRRELRLGFETSGRLLETVIMTFDDGRSMIIHAMKARKAYRALVS